jgi:hypothetical protein
MSIAVLWDRFFWSFMLMVFAGLVWLKVVGVGARYLPFGLLTGLIVGGAYFVIGVRSMLAARRKADLAVADAEGAAAAARTLDIDPNA